MPMKWYCIYMLRKGKTGWPLNIEYKPLVQLLFFLIIVKPLDK